jgi:hypothetical protein
LRSLEGGGLDGAEELLCGLGVCLRSGLIVAAHRLLVFAHLSGLSVAGLCTAVA